jgi:hypothetical protein
MNLLKLLFRKISPGVRDILLAILGQLEEEAKKTSNPYDDILVRILQTLLAVA